MVIKSALALLIGCIATAAMATDSSYSEDDLKARFKQNSSERKSAAERLKASRADNPNLTVIGDRDINYRLPNGKVVAGILLQNGFVAPAVKTQFGMRPACVTKDYRLVAGTFDTEKEIIKCNLAEAELAIIDAPNSPSQVGKDGAFSFADKYSSKPNEYTPSETDNSDSIKTGKQLSMAEAEEVKNTEDTQENAQATKYGSNSSAHSKSAASTQKKSSKTGNAGQPSNGNYTGYSSSTVNNGDIYIPPPRNSSSVATVAGVLTKNKNKFGILMGTWIEAELTRTASSAESGQIEFRLLESVEGRYRTLPANTVLFANKSFNVTSKRLESLTSVAITPGGDEFGGIQAYVYSLDRTAGLNGSIIRDREGELVTAGTNTLLTTAAATLPGSGNMASQAVGQFSQEMLSNEKKNAPKTPQAQIVVPPQRVLLKVAKSF